MMILVFFRSMLEAFDRIHYEAFEKQPSSEQQKSSNTVVPEENNTTGDNHDQICVCGDFTRWASGINSPKGVVNV
jgi:hypothetical protein